MISTRGVPMVVVGEQRLRALFHRDHRDLRPAPSRHGRLHPLEEALAAAALLRRQKLSLRGVRCVVVDEADDVLLRGFADDLDHVLRACPQAAGGATVQMVFVSATLAGEARHRIRSRWPEAEGRSAVLRAEFGGLRDADVVFVTAGAGMSAEAGIPTYRGDDSVYAGGWDPAKIEFGGGLEPRFTWCGEGAGAGVAGDAGAGAVVIFRRPPSWGAPYRAEAMYRYICTRACIVRIRVQNSTSCAALSLIQGSSNSLVLDE